uniref:Uncharacterized protein n=1 Tax=Rhizophora mucronata TaxID=61149 RepID=A0A2P2Q1F6_RHIMU
MDHNFSRNTYVIGKTNKHEANLPYFSHKLIKMEEGDVVFLLI